MAGEQARELPLVPAGEIPEVASLQELFAGSTDPAAPIFAYCRVPAIPECTPAELDAAHLASMQHCLKDAYEGAPPGIGGVMRNCTLETIYATAPIYDIVATDGVHPERGWVTKGRRYFQGCTDRITPEPGPFQKLAVHKIPPSAALIELPEVDGTPPILVRYAGAANGMCTPHGIAKGASRKPLDWHTEPGGDVLLLIVHNSAARGAAGFYVKPNAASARVNYDTRLDAWARGKYLGIHDDALLEWLATRHVPLTVANYVCVACGALPVTWAGNVISDPLTTNGNGKIHNAKKLRTAGFELRQGAVLLTDVEFPAGFAPPAELLRWARETDFKPVDPLDRLAREHPIAFRRYFPDWGVAAPPAAPAAPSPAKKVRFEE